MSDEKSKEIAQALAKIQLFDALVPKCAQRQETVYCAKQGKLRPTSGLKGAECLVCDHMTAKGGDCDPLT